MKQQYRAPLSGNVSQAINPWTWFTRLTGNQMGFINIHETRGGDTQLEHHIVSEVASYGRQLGRISDALRVMVERIDRSDLDEASRESLAAFESMADAVDEAKAGQASRRPEAAVDDAITALGRLRDEDPAAFKEQSQRLRAFLDQ
jgi:KaiC/GvpD/RAD55 family RecA-like ATPase